MRDTLVSFKKAVSALVAGTAFCLLFLTVSAPSMGKPVQNKGSGLYSEADLALLSGHYQEALDSFQKFLREYPGYPEIVAVRYKIAGIYFNLGNYQTSVNTSMEWLNLYPDSPLKGEVMSLLGDNYNALGNRPESFRWRLAAMKTNSAQDSQNLKKELNAKILDSINTGSRTELEQMAGYGSDSQYIPYIYHRLATISLEENKIEDVKKYAMLLVRSTEEETWVSIGRELLERISKTNKDESDSGKITIGCLLPLSGPFALYGQEVLNGIELGMDVFNRQQKGRNIDLVIKDTKGSADGANAGIKELADENNVSIIIGPLASAESTAAAKKAQELGVPIITFTQKEGITNEGDMVFRNFLTPSKEVEALLNKAMNERGMKRFAIFYPDKTYGQYLRDLFRERVKQMGGVITMVESYKPDQTDFAEGIKKITGSGHGRIDVKTANPASTLDFDAIFIPDNYEEIAMIAPQFPYYNAFNVPFLGTSLWMSGDLVKSTGVYLQGAIFPVGFSPDGNTTGIEEFVADYKDSFHSDPGVLASTGYDTIRLIKDIADKGNAKTRKDFQKELHKDLFDGVTGKISFDEKGEVKKVPILLTIDGESLKVMQ
jgi:branched-chain amino acid transport system substrate-binding protein